MSGERNVTALLLDWRAGDEAALERLLPLVYGELREIAEAHVRRERSGHTLQPTALVHETYLRLVAGAPRIDWKDRAHFFALASRVMRRVLVDHARRHQAAKRRAPEEAGAAWPAASALSRQLEDVLAVDRALEDLAKLEERQSRLVELRFFGGLTVEETAEVLEVSPATVKREWASARAWLHRELSRGAELE